MLCRISDKPVREEVYEFVALRKGISPDSVSDEMMLDSEASLVVLDIINSRWVSPPVSASTTVGELVERTKRAIAGRHKD